MKLAPDTARLTAPMIPLPPMPPPVLVAIWTASDIQENSPASDTIDSPSASESSSTGIVVPWIVSSMVGLLGWLCWSYLALASLLHRSCIALASLLHRSCIALASTALDPTAHCVRPRTALDRPAGQSGRRRPPWSGRTGRTGRIVQLHVRRQ